MMRVKRVLWNGIGNNNRNIEDAVNAFFEQENLCKDDVVHIDKDSGPDHFAFYIFYDDREGNDYDDR